MNSSKTAWLLLSPTIVILIIVGLLPFLYVLYVGFFNWMPLGKNKEMEFINFGYNYRELVFDKFFIDSVWRSIRFAIVTLALELTPWFFTGVIFTKFFSFKSFF